MTMCRWVVLVLVVAGCSTPSSARVGELVRANRIGPAQREAERELARASEVDRTMYLLEAGTCHLLAGDRERAYDRLREAAARMGIVSGVNEEAAMSVFRSESAKEFKGEPHEQCLCSCYLGWLAFQEGAYEAARAWFRAAQLADRTATRECDFALPLLFDALCSLQMADQTAFDNTAAQLVRIAPGLQPLLHTAPSGGWNTVVLVEDGNGPQKLASGTGGAHLAYDLDLKPLRPVEVQIAGKSVAMFDVGSANHQVSESGLRVADWINQGKAAFAGELRQRGGEIVRLAGEALANARQPGVDPGALRQIESGAGIAAAAAVVLFSVSLLARPGADLRGWTSLPRRFQVGLAVLPAAGGRATVRVGDPQLDQEWSDLPATALVALGFRILPGRCGGRWADSTRTASVAAR
ncbi:MAG: hypothetical protein IPK26_11760 [Planctomycetes bacterium]|nr:hypothetical protein [Planctomycetota bacterium]